MKLLGKLHPQFWRPKSSAAAGRDLDLAVASASGLDALETRLNHWSHLWAQETDAAARSEAQQVVAERLSRWIERCFGQHAQNSMRSKGSPLSLASSTPIFTAFLGRRATRELSRRVLQDI